MNEEREDVVVLTDEEGNETEFEYLSTVELGDKEYVVLLPLEDYDENAEEQEVLILKVEQDENGEDLFTSVDDDAELNKAFEVFIEQVEEATDIEAEDTEE